MSPLFRYGWGVSTLRRVVQDVLWPHRPGMLHVPDRYSAPHTAVILGLFEV